eukprot:1065333-Prorocentrum_minimum.AAC.1
MAAERPHMYTRITSRASWRGWGGLTRSGGLGVVRGVKVPLGVLLAHQAEILLAVACQRDTKRHIASHPSCTSRTMSHTIS